MKRPRDYQIAAADALWASLHRDWQSNPVVVMPTGTGKSLTMALFIWGFATQYPRARILNLVHVKELVAGNFKALKEMWPHAPAGVYSAGLKTKDDIRLPIMFAGIQSFRSVADRAGHYDIVIVDEAHRISPNGAATYQKVLTALRATNPNLVVVGFTATDFRMGSGRLTEEGGLFDVVCFDMSQGPTFVWLIEHGYLIRPVPKEPSVQVDDTNIKVVAGEFAEAEASAAFREQNILEAAVHEIVERGEDRQAWLTFAQSIEDAELIADMLSYYSNNRVEAVHSKRGDRDDVLAKFGRGEIRGVVNKDILTTGYDNPRIDLMAFLRMTRSPGLWVQMLGRGTRPSWAPGSGSGPKFEYDTDTLEGRRASILASHKQNCLVLDFAGNTMRLGPINYPNVPKRRSKGVGGPPVRLCPECKTYNHISLKVCEECGYEFPPPEEKRERKASTESLVLDLNSLPPPEPKEHGTFKVDRMIAAKHVKRGGGLPTLRVDYFAGVRRFSKWVCVEHGGFPRADAERWWQMHARGVPELERLSAPAFVEDALAWFAKLRKPTHIKVWLNTKWPEIEGYDFTGRAFQLPPELGGPEIVEVEEEKESAGFRQLQEMMDDDIPF